MNHRLASFAAVISGLAFVCGAAHAQGYGQPRGPGQAPPPPPEVRKGITLGVAIGGGELSCEDESLAGNGPCDGVTEAGSLDGHIGFMLNPKLAIVGDAWIMGHKDNDLTVSQTIVTGALQLWLGDRLWVKGGLGIAHARFEFDAGIVELRSRSESVPAGMLGVGFELLHKPQFALDVAFKAGTGIYEDDQTRAHNVAITVGANWF